MKKFFQKIGILMFFANIIILTSVAQNMNALEKGINAHKIVIPKNATAIDVLAAHELQYFLQLISDIKHPIVSDDKVRFEPVISIGKTERSRPLYNIYSSIINNEGFLIKTEKKDLFILGNEGKSVLYGVYYFLETYLNCNIGSPDEEKNISPQKNIILPPIYDLQNSSFDDSKMLYRLSDKVQQEVDEHKR